MIETDLLFPLQKWFYSKHKLDLSGMISFKGLLNPLLDHLPLQTNFLILLRIRNSCKVFLFALITFQICLGLQQNYSTIKREILSVALCISKFQDDLSY